MSEARWTTTVRIAQQAQNAAQQAIYNQEYLAYMANMQAQASPAMLNALGIGLAAQAQQFMSTPAIPRGKGPPLKVRLYMMMFRIFYLLFGRYPWEKTLS